MVPDCMPNPALAVFVTGFFEFLGAIALLIPPIAPWAAIGFILFLIAIFPANIQAARSQLTVDGRKILGLFPRGLIQLFFVGACLIVAAHN
jgi:uncharacterized membrane protein